MAIEQRKLIERDVTLQKEQPQSNFELKSTNLTQTITIGAESMYPVAAAALKLPEFSSDFGPTRKFCHASYQTFSDGGPSISRVQQ